MPERQSPEFTADARIAALFDVVPVPGDSDAFASRVEARLSRRRRVRLVLLSMAGLAGGGLAAAQAASTGLTIRIATLGHGGLVWSRAEPKRLLDAAARVLHPLDALLGAPPFHLELAPGQLGWLVAAAGAAAIVTRLQAREPV